MSRKKPPAATITPHAKKARPSDSNTLWSVTPAGYNEIPEGYRPLLEPVKGSVCKQHGCTQPAATNNRGFCPHHRQYYIIKDDAPGSLLLGLEFLSHAGGGSRSRWLCSCGSTKCRQIGYPTKGIFALPSKNQSERAEWLQALGLGGTSDDKIGKANNFRVAYWHFLPEHRQLSEDGMWKLLKPLGGKFVDNERKVWSCGTPPIASLSSFIEGRRSGRSVPVLRLAPLADLVDGVTTPRTVRVTASDELSIVSTKKKGPASAELSKMQKLLARESAQVRTAKIAYAAEMETSSKLRQKLNQEKVESASRLKSVQLKHNEELQSQKERVTKYKEQMQEVKRQLLQQQATGRRDSTEQAKQAATQRACDLRHQEELAQELMQTQQELTRTRQHLAETMQSNKALSKNEIAQLKREHTVVVLEKNKLLGRISELERDLASAVNEAKKIGTPLRYSHFLDSSSRMNKYVGVFFPLPDMECMELFLDSINVKKDEFDEGVCSRLRRHDYVKRLAKEKKEKAKSDPAQEGPLSPVKAKTSGTGKRGAPRLLHWKDEFLIYCCFHVADMTYKQIEALMGVTALIVHNAIRAFADYLDMFFELAFPNPTQDQIRQNYPSTFIETFAHASILMLLDCTDQETEDPRFKRLHSILWSQYHKQTGVKFAVGCTPIGHVPHPWCPDGRPSSITDPVIVSATNVIGANLRRGDMVEVDKGFLIENYCASMGIRVMRPTTFMKKQQQAMAADSQKTRDIGNTRIIIEQVNRQGKSEWRLWNRKFPLNMKDSLSQLMRNGFMFANFKPPFVIGHSGYVSEK